MDRSARRAGPADPGFAQLGERSVIVQRLLERAQLAIRLRRRLDLGLQHVGLLAAETVELDEEPADVS